MSLGQQPSCNHNPFGVCAQCQLASAFSQTHIAPAPTYTSAKEQPVTKSIPPHWRGKPIKTVAQALEAAEFLHAETVALREERETLREAVMMRVTAPPAPTPRWWAIGYFISGLLIGGAVGSAL